MTAHAKAQHSAVAGDDQTTATPPRASRVLGAAIFYALLSLILLAPARQGLVEEWWLSLFQCIVFALAPLVPLLVFVCLQSVPLWRDYVAGPCGKP